MAHSPLPIWLRPNRGARPIALDDMPGATLPPGPPGGDGDADADDAPDALDAYSRVVTRVAAHLLPRVVQLEVGRESGRGGSGSGVVITPDGYVLTSAHVVGRSPSATARFTDGAER